MKSISFFASGIPKGQPTWRQFGNYDVSDDGAVRRSPLSPKRGNVIPGRELKTKTQSNGYISVSICQGTAKHKTLLVHRLVALLFIPNPNELPHVNHINGIKSDNRAQNLEWVSAQTNYVHAVKTGLAPIGDRNGSRTKPESRPRGEASKMARLTADQVRQIRSLRLQGLTLSSIGQRFGVRLQTIDAIVKRVTWRHLE